MQQGSVQSVDEKLETTERIHPDELHGGKEIHGGQETGNGNTLYPCCPEVGFHRMCEGR